MAGLDLNLVIGAALSNSVGQVFSSIKKQANSTVKNTEKIQLGKKWAEELIYLEKRLKANDMLAQKVGRDMHSIKLRNELIKQLADAKREAEKFGINLKNAKSELSKLNKEAAKEERKAKFGEAFEKFRGDAAKTAASYYGFKTVIGKGLDFTKDFARFESGMANTATLLDGDKLAKKARIKELGSAVKKMSLETGLSMANLQEGLYQTVSAFGDTAETSDRLEIAAKSAMAGGATTADAINLLSAVTKGYNDTSAEASQKAMDLAFNTVKLGQTSFPELAHSMGAVIPLASTLGIKQEELFGAFATLTGVTGGTSEVATQMRGALQGFLQPTAQMTNALRKLGYANGMSALKAQGLGGMLEKLKQSVGGNEVAFAQLFGSIEAKNAVLALTGAQAESFGQKTASMMNSAGAATEAYSEKSETAEARSARLQTNFAAISLNIGEALMPAFDSLSKLLTSVTSFIGRFTEQFPFLSQAVFYGTAALMGFRLALNVKNTLYDTVLMLKNTALAQYAGAAATKVITAVQWLWNAALAANPIGLVIAGIVAFIAIGAILVAKWKPIVAWFKNVFGKIGDFISSIFGKTDKLKAEVKTDEKIDVKEKLEKPKIGDVLTEKQELSNFKGGDFSGFTAAPTQNKSVNVTISNFTVNSQNIDEALPKIVDRVREAIRQGVKDDMENSYAY